MVGTRRRTYLIQDPYDTDALEFIRTMAMSFGLSPTCLYSDPKARFYGERAFPILRSPMVRAAHDVDLRDLGALADEVRDQVVGIIPYREDTVEVAAELLEHFDVGWNDPETLRRFRDKFELKAHVRCVDPTVRVPHCRLVRSAEDLRTDDLPTRFVIKPNDGFGNVSIGVFDRGDLREAIAHVESRRDVTWILEEYIDGVEYHVDGQVRGPGEVTALAVMEYVREIVNGYPTVYVGEVQCTTDHALFEQLTGYAERLLTATGLQRCPFHLEVKVDDRGPCLIDLGARFPSEGGALTLSRLHPGRLSAYAVASHDYLGENSVATEPVDWTAYDSARTVLAYGISQDDGLISSLRGIEEVEQLPEFVRWPVRPRIGDELVPTEDLRGAPYIVELSCPGSEDDARELIDRVQQMVRWNTDSSRRSAAAARLTDLSSRARRKVPWVAHRVGEQLRSGLRR